MATQTLPHSRGPVGACAYLAGRMAASITATSHPIRQDGRRGALRSIGRADRHTDSAPTHPPDRGRMSGAEPHCAKVRRILTTFTARPQRFARGRMLRAALTSSAVSRHDAAQAMQSRLAIIAASVGWDFRSTPRAESFQLGSSCRPQSRLAHRREPRAIPRAKGRAISW